jgi:hypothetical protein
MRFHGLILLGLLLASAFLLAGSFSNVKAQDHVGILSTTIYQNYGFNPFSVSKGDYLVVGEVQNSGSQAQKFNITATFYDGEGYILGSSYLSDSNPDASPCYMHVLLPNAKSPFEIWFSRFDEEGNFRLVDHYELVVNTSPAGTYFPSLEITSQSSHETDGTLYVEGNIKNTGTKTMNHFNTFVTFYNQNSEVVAVAMETGYSSSPISESMGFAPGEIASFIVGLNGFNEGGRLEAISNYTITAEGYDNSQWTDGHLTTPEVVYILGTPQETVAPVAAQDQPYLVYVVAIVVAVILIAVAYLLVRKRAKNKKGNLHQG